MVLLLKGEEDAGWRRPFGAEAGEEAVAEALPAERVGDTSGFDGAESASVQAGGGSVDVLFVPRAAFCKRAAGGADRLMRWIIRSCTGQRALRVRPEMCTCSRSRCKARKSWTRWEGMSCGSVLYEWSSCCSGEVR